MQPLAYSHEVSSCGFWPNGAAEGVFYSYAYPQPAGFADARRGNRVVLERQQGVEQRVVSEHLLDLAEAEMLMRDQRCLPILQIREERLQTVRRRQPRALRTGARPCRARSPQRRA